MSYQQKIQSAIVLAALMLCSSLASAQIYVESAGLSTTKLEQCPQQLPLNCGDFYQYKVVGYYTQLTLGAIQAKPQSPDARPLKAWNRLTLRANHRLSPIDVFKSSKSASSTSHQAMPCAIWNAEKENSTPVISIQGNTNQPKGYVILCVDFVPVPPRPRGKLRITRANVRDGEKAPLSWKTQR